MDHESIGKLIELEFLSGDLRTADRFNEFYTILLNECQATNDQGMLRAMQEILWKQAAFGVNEWLKDKAATNSTYPMGSLN